MQVGFIKLHRRLLEWEWYDDINCYRLFTHLLLTVNYEPRKWHGKTINSGQTVTSRESLALQTGLSEQQVRTALNKLKSTNEITTQSTNNYTVITITNWKIYQEDNQPSNQRATSQQPTDNQRITTPKEVKKERSKEYTDDCITPASVKEIFAWLEIFFNSPVPYITAPIEAWINWGADFEKDIKPAAERFMKRKGSPPRSLKWLDEEIAKSIEQRKQPMPDVKTENYHIRGENAVSVTEHNNAIIEGLKKKIKAEEEARL